MNPENLKTNAPETDICAALVAAGCEIGSHESDLHVKSTPAALTVLAAYSHDARTFISAIDGALWLDIPFAYSPFWAAKALHPDPTPEPEPETPPTLASEPPAPVAPRCLPTLTEIRTANMNGKGFFFARATMAAWGDTMDSFRVITDGTRIMLERVIARIGPGNERDPSSIGERYLFRPASGRIEKV